MVAKGDFVAAALFCLGIEIAAAHFRAEEARMLRRMAACDAQHICIEDLERNVQFPRILLQMSAAFGRISGIHRQKFQLEIHRVLQIPQQQAEQHGVLAARNAHRNAVARAHHVIFLYRIHKRLAYRAHKLALQRLSDLSCCHFTPFLC